jgi:hypothetical protein
MKEQFELAGVGRRSCHWFGLGLPSESARMRRSAVLKVGKGAGMRLSYGRRSARGWEATVLLYVPIGVMVSVQADGVRPG